MFGTNVSDYCQHLLRTTSYILLSWMVDRTRKFIHALCAFKPKLTHTLSTFKSKFMHKLCAFKPKLGHTLYNYILRSKFIYTLVCK